MEMSYASAERIDGVSCTISAKQARIVSLFCDIRTFKEKFPLPVTG